MKLLLLASALGAAVLAVPSFAQVDLATCSRCHNPDFSGGENVLRVANQREDYLRKALSDYKKGARAGFGNAVMPETLAGLKAGELADLAHFLAYLER